MVIFTLKTFERFKRRSGPPGPIGHQGSFGVGIKLTGDRNYDIQKKLNKKLNCQTALFDCKDFDSVPKNTFLIITLAKLLTVIPI